MTIYTSQSIKFVCKRQPHKRSTGNTSRLCSHSNVHLCLQLATSHTMAAQCVTKVELTVSCDNLLDKDIGSKSDPLCVLLMSSSDSQWYEVSGIAGFGFIQYQNAVTVTIVTHHKQQCFRIHVRAALPEPQGTFQIDLLVAQSLQNPKNLYLLS